MTDEDVLGVPCYSWTPAAGPGNFGDELGPMIVRRLLARAGVEAPAADARARLISVGSVAHFAGAGDALWGTGVNGKVTHPSFAPRLDVRAVRGPLTRITLLGRGVDAPEIYGDPALLAPRLFPHRRAESPQGVVVVPNFNDLDLFDAVDVVSPRGAPEAVIEQILRAEYVIASSLHALIIADAYGIPSRPLLSEAEHPFKYLDYYAGTGRGTVEFARDIAHAHALGPVPALEADLDPLEAAFPIDLWTEPGAHRAAPRSLFDLREESASERLSLEERIDPESAASRDALERLDAFVWRERVSYDGCTREQAAEHGVTAPHLRRRSASEAPTLSIVIVARDDEGGIDDAVSSALAVEEADEIVLVEAGSRDRTPRAVALAEERDPRIRAVWAAEPGSGGGIDLGLDQARGRFALVLGGGERVPAADARRALRAARDADADLVALAPEAESGARALSTLLMRRRFVESRGLRAGESDLAGFAERVVDAAETVVEAR